jgi:parallel beta-helix repeat protein
MKRNSLRTAFLIVSISCTFVLVNVPSLLVAHASTTFNSTIITTDTTWTKANSPYTITGPVAVASGAALAIEPGVTVNLGTYYLQVNGTLRARGSSTDRILFSSSATQDLFQITFNQGSTSWNEQTGSGSIIENAIVNASISITGVSPKISNNSITDNTAGMMNTNVGINIEGGSPVVTNNHINGGIDVRGEGSALISNNVITGGMGIWAGSHVISNNEISGGSSYFWIGRSWDRDYDVVVVGGGSPVISGNKISGSTLGIGSSEFAQVINAIIINNTVSGCGTGISVSAGDGGTLTIKGNLITQNTGTALRVSGNIPNPIEGNLITNNSVGIQISADSQVTIQKNTIANNPIGILTSSHLATISNNNIQSYNYSLKQGTLKDIDAANNWWGTTDAAAISQSIFDNKNDFNLGKVNFVPFLTAPSPDAPAIMMVPSSTLASNPEPTTSPSSSPSPDSDSSSTPSPSPSPSDNSTAAAPSDQTGNPSSSQLDIKEIVIATLVAVVIVLSIIMIVMHRRSRTEKKNATPPVNVGR